MPLNDDEKRWLREASSAAWRRMEATAGSNVCLRVATTTTGEVRVEILQALDKLLRAELIQLCGDLSGDPKAMRWDRRGQNELLFFRPARRHERRA